jgi:hypothetical protein
LNHCDKMTWNFVPRTVSYQMLTRSEEVLAAPSSPVAWERAIRGFRRTPRANTADVVAMCTDRI